MLHLLLLLLVDHAIITNFKPDPPLLAILLVINMLVVILSIIGDAYARSRRT